MSKKPSKPRVARASVVRQIVDPVQEAAAKEAAKAEEAKKASSAEGESAPAKAKSTAIPNANEDAAETKPATSAPQTPSRAAAPSQPASNQPAAQPSESGNQAVPIIAAKSVAKKPAAQKPAAQKPAAQKPVAQKPVAEGPIMATRAAEGVEAPIQPNASIAGARQATPAATPQPATPQPAAPQPAAHQPTTPSNARPQATSNIQPQTVPTTPQQAAPSNVSVQQTPSNVSMQDLLAPLQTPIEPIDVSAGYNFSAIFVAGAVMLLPLVYLFMVGLVAVASVWWAVSGLGVAGGSFFLYLIIYAFPSLFGLVFVFFMIKPLFAPPDASSVHFSLEREKEPAIFEFVEHVCAAVGSPVPKRIDVDNNANASASFRRGIMSFFGDDDLVLTIGLPLVGAMNIREVTGILAHEFGHFTQGSAMRLQHSIRRINLWFARVVYERDGWDERLEYWIHVLPSRLSILPLFLKLCVFLSRCVLWVLLRIAAFLSSYLSRQMEFDADRHQLRLCGTESFIQCEYEIHFLNHTQMLAHQDLQASWSEGRLSDDLPALVVANIDWIRRKPKMADSIRKDVAESKTEWLDTHPASSERIALAQKEFCPGQFQVRAPARILFRDFQGLCKSVTLTFYQEIFTEKIDASNLVPAQLLYQEQVATAEAHQTLNRFFQGKVLGSHELFLPPETVQPAPQFDAALRGLKGFREHMLLGLEQMALAVKTFDEADDRVRELAIASVLIDSGFQADPGAFKLRAFTRQEIFRARQHADANRAQQLERMLHATNDTRNRLILSLRMVQNGEMTQRITEVVSVRQNVALYLQTLNALETTWPHLLRLRETKNILAGLLQYVDEGDDQLINQIMRMTEISFESIRNIRRGLNHVPYPFSHAKGAITVSKFVLDKPPMSDDPIEVLEAAEEVVDKLLTLYYRLMSQLAVVAESVETVIGLPKLPDPKEDEDLSEDERKAMGL